jgi:hypothetical protein
MTNSQKTQLIQQNESPNWDRIKSLVSDGMDWDEAERIDALERREALLCELGAAGELTSEQKQELDTIQTQLMEAIGSPHVEYAGIGFTEAHDRNVSGDGAPAEAEPGVETEQERISLDELTDLREQQRTAERLASSFLTQHAEEGDEMALRIATEYAQTATELEDRIDRALVDAARRETTPAP